MSTTFLFGYIAFMVVTIIGVNLIARRSRPARLAGASDAPLDEVQLNTPDSAPMPAPQVKTQERAPLATADISIPKVLTVLLIGMFIAILNQTLINVALPVLINDFNVSTSTAQWLTTGFMLVNGILIPCLLYTS